MSLANLANLSRVTFEPLDLLLFAGRGADSRAIAMETCSWWQLAAGQWFSHVGIVARHPQHNRLLAFESTTLCDLPCEIQGKLVSGVQAHDPRRRVANYDGRVWRLRLTDPLVAGADASELAASFLMGKIGVRYGYLAAAIAGTRWLRFARWLHPDRSHLFCSFLAMGALKAARVVDQDLNPATYSPAGMARDLVFWGTYQPIGKGSESKRIK